MNLLTAKQENAISGNVIKTIETGDIRELTKAAYNYLYLCSGFIAHYDGAGFCAHYQNTEDLRRAILRHKSDNQWLNFRPGEKDFEYYRQKAKIYNAICAGIEHVKRDDRWEADFLLQNIFRHIGCDLPNNYEKILDFCLADCRTAAGPEWTTEDLRIAFRRFVERGK